MTIVSNIVPEIQMSGALETRRPVFIVGPSRSGSTLLAKMLHSHPHIAMFPETWCYSHLDHLGCSEEFTDEWQYILFINSVWQSVYEQNVSASRIIAIHAAQRPRYVGPTLPILEGLASTYLHHQRARIWGEKTPAHLLFLGRMRKLFPEARILVMVRDPRDILVSYDDRWGGSRRDTAFLLDSAATVCHYLDQLPTNPFPPGQVHQIKYEDLTSDCALTLKGVCRFLEIEFDPVMLEFYRRMGDDEIRAMPHHRLLTRPVTTERVGRYREVFTRSQIALIEEFLRQPMNDLGYFRETEPRPSLNLREKYAQTKALKFYGKMQSGLIRRRARQKAHIRLLAYKWAEHLLSLGGRRVAATSDEWLRRAEISSGTSK